ncbi:MAG: MFS transporter [Actinomycetes bacterium]
MREILRLPHYRRFLIARFISNFGNGMGPIALAFGILHMRGGSASLLGWILGIQTIAMLCMSPIGGVIADKYGRVRVLGMMDIIGGSAFLVQAYFFSTGHVPVGVFLAVNVVFGLSWGVFWPAFGGLMPALVGEEELQKANSTNQFVANIAIISGTATGGILVSTIGSTLALTVDALSFIICGIIVFSLRRLTVASKGETSMLDDLKHGWKVFLSFRWIVAIVAAFGLIVMCWAAAENILGPLISLKNFSGAKSWSIVLSAEAVGYVVGSLLGMRIRPKYPMRFLMLMTLSVSVYIFSLAHPQPLWVIAVCAFFWGITLDLWGAIWTTALQKEVPRDSLSRVSAFDGMGSLSLRPLGLAIAAPMANWLGLDHTLVILAILSGVVTLLTLAVPQVWKMQFSENS